MFLLLGKHYLEVCQFKAPWIYHRVFTYSGEPICNGRMVPECVNGLLRAGHWDIRPMAYLKEIGLQDIVKERRIAPVGD